MDLTDWRVSWADLQNLSEPFEVDGCTCFRAILLVDGGPCDVTVRLVDELQRDLPECRYALRSYAVRLISIKMHRRCRCVGLVEFVGWSEAPDGQHAVITEAMRHNLNDCLLTGSPALAIADRHRIAVAVVRTLYFLMKDCGRLCEFSIENVGLSDTLQPKLLSIQTTKQPIAPTQPRRLAQPCTPASVAKSVATALRRLFDVQQQYHRAQTQPDDERADDLIGRSRSAPPAVAVAQVDQQAGALCGCFFEATQN